MTFVLTWCANIFVKCSVGPTFFRQITSFSDSFHYTKICTWEVLIIFIHCLNRVELAISELPLASFSNRVLVLILSYENEISLI